MPGEQLKTEMRVQAWLRRCTAAGLMATVMRRGDSEAGALFLKINRLAKGCEVFSGVSTSSGRPGWMRATGALPVREKEADAYLARQAQYDADIWVLEVEDPKGTFQLDEPIVDL